MNADDNSVNIKPAKRGYHHGDLRSALIVAGLNLLRKGAVEELSLREVARTVGVSATAVYRHFPDKQSLLQALCIEGAEALGASQRAAMMEAGGGKPGFEATGQAYIRFALANPALYRLMMSTRPPEGLMPDEDGALNGAMRLLRENVAALLPPDASTAEKRQAAIHAWALVHGMAMLMLDEQVPRDEEMICSISRGPML
jgi:AcrR family transcriptional regulator